MKQCIFVSLLVMFSLSGCAGITSQPTPIEVALIPNDCANSHHILPWLEGQLNRPPGLFQTNSQYEESIRAIKHRIWTFRHHCNSVDGGL